MKNHEALFLQYTLYLHTSSDQNWMVGRSQNFSTMIILQCTAYPILWFQSSHCDSQNTQCRQLACSTMHKNLIVTMAVLLSGEAHKDRDCTSRSRCCALTFDYRNLNIKVQHMYGKHPCLRLDHGAQYHILPMVKSPGWSGHYTQWT